VSNPPVGNYELGRQASPMYQYLLLRPNRRSLLIITFWGRSTQFHAIKHALLPREHSRMALRGVVTDSNSPSQRICLNSDMPNVAQGAVSLTNIPNAQRIVDIWVYRIRRVGRRLENDVNGQRHAASLIDLQLQ
jgi:hypothetical protein